MFDVHNKEFISKRLWKVSRSLLNKLLERYNSKIKHPVFYSVIGTTWTIQIFVVCPLPFCRSGGPFRIIVKGMFFSLDLSIFRENQTIKAMFDVWVKKKIFSWHWIFSSCISLLARPDANIAPPIRTFWQLFGTWCQHTWFLILVKRTSHTICWINLLLVSILRLSGETNLAFDVGISQSAQELTVMLQF